MKLAFVVCVLTLALHGCNNMPPKPNQPLNDGRWGEHNGLMTEACAIDAMIKAATYEEADSLFNKCVFDQGLTI
ncbi:MAG: hypothetical protein [Bacteriophage sp.]|nr:MAG: hypothetical protein [Bacteriophage sp.]